jgi:hypothetical protein
MGNQACGRRLSDENPKMQVQRIQYRLGTIRFGAKKIIAEPAKTKNIPVAPCRALPAKKTATIAPRTSTACTTAERNGGYDVFVCPLAKTRKTYADLTAAKRKFQGC